MQKEFQFQVSPQIAADQAELKQAVKKKFKLPPGEIKHIEILRRSIDARKKEVKINLKIRVYVNEDVEDIIISKPEYENISTKEEVIIIGAGPAGLFAALKCIELG
ncbi:MAG: FAD-binding protein, partial [Cyclobacteriaceae bacterium]|nr:FAD-binding protein [Cyclobacteriaceae bacterium]